MAGKAGKNTWFAYHIGEGQDKKNETDHAAGFAENYYRDYFTAW